MSTTISEPPARRIAQRRQSRPAWFHFSKTARIISPRGVGALPNGRLKRAAVPKRSRR